jgi:hypothetical protein
METNLMNLFGTDPKQLEEYIRQIKSYEAQVEIIEKTAKEEEELKKNRPNWKLVLWTGIAGIQHHVNDRSAEGKKLIKSLVPGTELKLVREKRNQYDRWAIAIHTVDGVKIGYVTRYKNETIARLMDAGFKFHAFVESRRKSNYQVPDEQRAFTENFVVPYSVWME